MPHNFAFAWKLGWRESPRLAESCDLWDGRDEMLKIQASYLSPHTNILFSDDPSLPPTSSTEDDWRLVPGSRFLSFQDPGGPSQIWRQARGLVCGDHLRLIEEVDWKSLDSTLFHEEVWNQAVGLCQRNRLFTERIEWEAIESRERIFRSIRMWKWLEARRAQEPQGFSSPHPPADIANPDSDKVWSFFSADSAVPRSQSIYATAFAAYQRIVAEYLPTFRHDLKLAAWWPCRLVGEVTGSTDEGWWVYYHCEPVESESDAVVIFKLSNPPDRWASNEGNKFREKVSRMRPNAPSWYWRHGAQLNLFDTHPSNVLVNKWLADDLRDAGWKT